MLNKVVRLERVLPVRCATRGCLREAEHYAVTGNGLRHGPFCSFHAARMLNKQIGENAS